MKADEGHFDYRRTVYFVQITTDFLSHITKYDASKKMAKNFRGYFFAAHSIVSLIRVTVQKTVTGIRNGRTAAQRQHAPALIQTRIPPTTRVCLDASVLKLDRCGMTTDRCVSTLKNASHTGST